MDKEQIFAIARPAPVLLKLYLIRSILSGPFFIFVFPAYLIRYLTLRYRFDDKGISMRWGFFFRREVNFTYSRMQDIHLVSGLIQRWLGLADIMIQTASGNADAEMKIEGIHEFEDLRHFLYTRMRGYADLNRPAESSEAPAGQDDESEDMKSLLRDIRDELKTVREAMNAKNAAR